jgi:hypothetical protein
VRPVMALAGRRVDPPDQPVPRFPLANVSVVSARVHTFLERRRPAALVCSAACGADLLALDAAGALGLRRRIVLPFDRAVFRRSSVVDRPGDWGPLYDRVIEEVEAAGDLVVLDCAPDGEFAYERTNERILEEALSLAHIATDGPHQTGSIPPDKAVALIVWEGRSRGEGDLTEQFAALARGRGMTVEEILTV